MFPENLNGWLFSDVAAAWLPILFDAAVKSVVVLGLAWAVVLGLRRSSAAARHVVWLLALASLPALAILSAVSPGWNVLPHWPALGTAATRQSAAASRPETGLPYEASPVPSPIDVEAAVPPRDVESAVDGGLVRSNEPFGMIEAHDTQAGTTAWSTTEAPAADAAAQPRGPSPMPTWPAWCLLAWLVGAALALVPLGLAMLSLRRIERKSRRISEGPLALLAGQLSRELGVARRVELLVSERRWMPMQWGVLRPKLLLPASASAWPADRLRAVLLHELGHVRRCDCLSQLTAQLVCAVFWVNPLAWVARRRMQMESEAACDDLALEAGVKPSDYARHVLQIASGAQADRIAACGAIAMARRSRLEGRLLAILDPKRNRRGISRLLMGALLAAAIATVVPLAMLRAGPGPEASGPATAESPADSPALEAVASPNAGEPAAAEPAAATQQDAEEAQARAFIASLKQHQFDQAAAEFVPALAEALPAKRLRRFWQEFEQRCGPFQEVLSCRRRQFDNGRVMEARCAWEKSRMLVRLAFDEESRIAGFWLARDREGPTPEHFRRGGYLYGPAIERIAGAHLTLEGRIVGLDGQPVKKSSIAFWKALDDESERDERCWNDPATGRIWRGIGGAATGDHRKEEQLSPGVYRITAAEGHHQSTPVGLSEPIHLDGSEPHTVVTVRMIEGPTLTLRPTDGETGAPLPDVFVTLKREDDVLPPRWNYRPPRDSDPMAIEHLPPGKYRLTASRRARRAEDLQYELVDGPMEIAMTGGEDREVTVPLVGRPLTEEEIDGRWPWVAQGKVTDAEGRPMEGVEVWAHCGMRTLRRTGLATTDADGEYTVRFAAGRLTFSDNGKPPVNFQMATITAHKPGYTEKNLNHHGGLRAANRLPDEDENYRIGDPAQIILPGKPRRLDFVMVSAAGVHGQVLDGEGNPVADRRLSIRGGRMPPSSSVLRSGSTDEQGRFQFDEVPKDYAWQFCVPLEGRRDEVKTPPFRLNRAEDFRITLRLAEHAASGVTLLEIVGITDPQGAELRDQLVGDDPFARPPVGPELQAKGIEILQKMAQANRCWLVAPPPEVKNYAYDFCLAGKEPKSCRISDPPKKNTWLRQGISYYSVVHYLAARPEQAVFRLVDVGEDAITLVYDLKKSIRASAGNGLVGTWHGFFSTGVGQGKLVLDAKTLVPREHRCAEFSETFSEYAEIRPGQYAPLRIRIDKMQFDWTFRVYEPGLWLFDASRADREELEDGIVARVDNVQVNGQPAEVMAAAP